MDTLIIKVPLGSWHSSGITVQASYFYISSATGNYKKQKYRSRQYDVQKTVGLVFG